MSHETLDRAGEPCTRVTERLAVLVDGGLGPLDEARDRGHLEACAPCQRALARHAQLLASLRSLSSPAVERDVALDVVLDVAQVSAAVRAALERCAPRFAPRPRAERIPRRWAVGLAAAAAAVLLLAALEGATRLAPLAPIRWASLDWSAPLPSWSEVVRGLESFSRRLS